MNAKDIIYYGDYEVTKAIEGLADEEWTKPGVTTLWSVKDVMAHLASYERLLEDALLFVAKPGTPTPTLDTMNADQEKFNDIEIGKRKDKSSKEILDEYAETHERVVKLIDEIGPEKLREVGTIPWYGSDYSPDDFIIYASYGHKREHTGQIKIFRKRLGK